MDVRINDNEILEYVWVTFTLEFIEFKEGTSLMTRRQLVLINWLDDDYFNIFQDFFLDSQNGKVLLIVLMILESRADSIVILVFSSSSIISMSLSSLSFHPLGYFVSFSFKISNINSNDSEWLNCEETFLLPPDDADCRHDVGHIVGSTTNVGLFSMWSRKVKKGSNVSVTANLTVLQLIYNCHGNCSKSRLRPLPSISPWPEKFHFLWDIREDDERKTMWRQRIFTANRLFRGHGRQPKSPPLKETVKSASSLTEAPQEGLCHHRHQTDKSVSRVLHSTRYNDERIPWVILLSWVVILSLLRVGSWEPTTTRVPVSFVGCFDRLRSLGRMFCVSRSPPSFSSVKLRFHLHLFFLALLLLGCLVDVWLMSWDHELVSGIKSHAYVVTSSLVVYGISSIFNFRNRIQCFFYYNEWSNQWE